MENLILLFPMASHWVYKPHSRAGHKMTKTKWTLWSFLEGFVSSCFVGVFVLSYRSFAHMLWFLFLWVFGISLRANACVCAYVFLALFLLGIFSVCLFCPTLFFFIVYYFILDDCFLVREVKKGREFGWEKKRCLVTNRISKLHLRKNGRVLSTVLTGKCEPS